MQEASLHEENSFITLTYSPELIPEDNGLEKEHIQEFMRRLRKTYNEQKIRYFGCGEYGETTQRPHYHLILFGFEFPLQQYHTKRGEHTAYTSPALNEMWPYGLGEIGTVTHDSAGYIAKYTIKKLKGIDAAQKELHYNGRQPEFAIMSRRPGIGAEWYKKYKKELVQNDSVIVNGHEVKIPRYYDEKLSQDFPAEHAGNKGKRKRRITYEETAPGRLESREINALARYGQKPERSL